MIRQTPPTPCPPFSPCWCETRPNHPNCQGQPEAVKIGKSPEIFLMMAVVSFYVFLQNKLENLKLFNIFKTK